jgi:hypothetical protein
MRMLIRLTILIAGLLAAFAVLSVGLIALFMPSNAQDAADPSKRLEMVRITLEWGRLAPFPVTATDFDIKTEGSAFTRSFRGSFTDAPERVEAWIAASSGVNRADCTQTTEGEKCLLRTAKGVSYGEVVVSPNKCRVTFYVAWS